MKIILAISIILLAFSGCKKEDNRTYCAECEEMNSHYKAANYCGTSDDVDNYITKLKQLWGSAQNWNYQKK